MLICMHAPRKTAAMCDENRHCTLHARYQTTTNLLRCSSSSGVPGLFISGASFPILLFHLVRSPTPYYATPYRYGSGGGGGDPSPLFPLSISRCCRLLPRTFRRAIGERGSILPTHSRPSTGNKAEHLSIQTRVSPTSWICAAHKCWELVVLVY